MVRNKNHSDMASSQDYVQSFWEHQGADQGADEPALDYSIFGGQQAESFTISPTSATQDTEDWLMYETAEPTTSIRQFPLSSTNPFHKETPTYGERPAAYTDRSDAISPALSIAPLDTFERRTRGESYNFSHVGMTAMVPQRPYTAFATTRSSRIIAPHSPTFNLGALKEDASDDDDMEDELEEAKMKLRPMSPLSRCTSRSTRRGSPLLVRDGRKKNAKIEISPEITLETIDPKIKDAERAGDAEGVKDLKATKRLLRNRQAALDSRQRKKKHTEQLEGEVSMLKDAIRDLHVTIDNSSINMADLQTSNMVLERQLHDQEQAFMREMADLRHQKEVLEMDAESRMRVHTEETRRLRAKNTKLESSVRTGRLGAMGVPSASVDTEFDDMMLDNEKLWSNEDFLNDLPDGELVEKIPTFTPTSSEQPSLAVSDEERPAASGLLLMILMFGAFVASRNNGSSSSSVLIPKMPEDIRVASATVLDTLFQDAGVPSMTPSVPRLSLISSPTGLDNAWTPIQSSTGVKTTLSPTELLSMSPAAFAPSMDAFSFGGKVKHENDDLGADSDLFSLSSSAYASLVNPDYPGLDFKTAAASTTGTSTGRRNLQECLANLRRPGVAEVCNRSLMLDKVPAEVVREFAELVGIMRREV